jgi:predicted O-methyltransferase YrrM
LRREGDAVQTLARDLPEEIDLVLLDGAKNLYMPILKLLEPKLKAGALVAADDADFEPEYQEYVRDPANGYVSLDLAFEKGNELSVRVART